MAATITSPLFVGRERELAALESALTDAEEGRPSGVLVGGEAGVGKSRLLAEFAVRAEQYGVRTLFGHCIEVGEGELPYAPVVGALRALAAELDPPDVHAILGPARDDLALLVPDLAPESAAPRADSPALGQARLFELLLGVLGRLGRERPLALVMEDIHWADRSTRDLIRFLIRSATTERVALVATYRADELHRRHPLRPFLSELDREPRVRRVDVAPFSREEVARQVDAIVGSTLDPRAVDHLFARSEGNAFFTEELLAASGGEDDLPDSLRDVLLVRLERLGEGAQRVVRVAAAVGRRVDHRLLSDVAAVDGPELREALREAVAAQVLVTPPREHAYEFRHALLREAAYDDLLPGEREELHVAIARALEARPEVAGTDARPAAELAYHWHAARDLAMALPASIAAGREAERVYAFAEAHQHYERALAIWDSGPDHDVDRVDLTAMAARAAHRAGDPDRAAALGRAALTRVDPVGDPVRASLLHEALGRYLETSGESEQALVAYAHAIERMPPAPSAERAYVLASQARLLAVDGRVVEARPLVEEALAIARAVGARAVEAGALSTLVVALSGVGLTEDGVAAGDEAVAVAEQVGAGEELIRAYANSAQVLENAGRLEESLHRTLDGVAASRRTGGERSWGVHLVGEAVARLVKLGRLSQAGELVDEAMALRPVGLALSGLHGARADVAVARGDGADARAAIALARGGSSFEVSKLMWEAPMAATATQFELWNGDADAALEIVTSALAAVDENEWVNFSVPLYPLGCWAYADVAGRARALKRTAEAEAARAGAAGLAERLDVKLDRAFGDSPPPLCLVWRTQLAAELSRLDGPGDAGAWEAARRRWAELGYAIQSVYCAWRQAEALLAGQSADRAAAREVVVAAHAIAAECGSKPLRDELEALARRARIDLAATDGPAEAEAAAPSPAESAGLTPREAEVLELVVEGRTNRQIAETLFISDKTASVHVSRILSKLDAANRGEAAAIARRLGVRAADDG